MMNMKKLIDETDFDNLSELTKRWGNQQKPQTQTHTRQIEKQNDFKKSNEIQSTPKEQFSEIGTTEKSKQVQGRKHNVLPQIVDEDTEHFKNKLEHLLNNFKTDAVAEFMSMKREMLDYQQECVKTDTHKYLTMYEQKHKQLLETKEKLLQTCREAEKKTIQVQHLSNHIHKLNERIKTYKYVSRPFSILYQNMVQGKQLKFKMKEAAKFDQKRLKRKSLWGWMNIYSADKAQKQKQEAELRIETQVNEIVGRFQKQMEMLKQRLAQATRKNQEYENNKHIVQQNLKKAFLRGVCAMNMEAMGVLGTENVQENDWLSEKQKNDRQKSMFANNMSYVQPKNSSLMIREEINQNQSMLVSRQNVSSSRQNMSNLSQQKNQNIIIQSQKAQSKNFKWKEAPIMGIQEPKDEEQPRMQVVRPTTEGKVIKIVQGKSSVEVKKVNDKVAVTSSRKKI